MGAIGNSPNKINWAQTAAYRKTPMKLSSTGAVAVEFKPCEVSPSQVKSKYLSSVIPRRRESSHVAVTHVYLLMTCSCLGSAYAGMTMRLWYEFHAGNYVFTVKSRYEYLLTRQPSLVCSSMLKLLMTLL